MYLVFSYNLQLIFAATEKKISNLEMEDPLKTS